MLYDPKHIALLLFKHLDGTLSGQDRRALDGWRNASVERKALIEQIEDDERFCRRAIKQLPENFDPISARMLSKVADATKNFSQVSTVKTVTGQRPVRRVHFLETAWCRSQPSRVALRWAKYAAAIILFIGIGVAGYFTLTRNDKNTIVQKEKPTTPAPAASILPGSNKAVLTLSDGRKIELDSAASGTITDQNLSIENNNGQLKYGSSRLEGYNTMTTPRGGQYQVILPDGTKVWLNAASSITYPTAFTSNNRTVNIEGEAYFEVAKDAKKPFIVKTYQDEITVLGTAFNINAYKDERAIKTSLVEGSVKINQIILQPGQAYVNGKVKTTNVQQDIAWKNGVFDFNDLNIEQASRQIARWYDVDVQFKGPLPNVFLFGKLPRSVTLVELTKALDGVVAHFKLEGRVLQIRKI